jgi:3-hydroxybutyryl-CoA dehydrogenase
MSVKRFGIVGSGIMGAGVAEVAAKAGIDVVLRSRAEASAQEMLATLEKSLLKQVEKGKLEDDERLEIQERVRTVTDVNDLADCDLVLESVVEDMDVKKELLAELDQVCAPDAIIATNTSTLNVGELANATKRPDKVCGMHFFNPAPVMPLVELIRANKTSDDTIATVRAFAESCGKDVVDVEDRAGFIVNALLFPYLNNAVKLLEAGTANRDDIDTAMKGGCNFPMGPLELLDLVGLDTSLSILEALYVEHKDENFQPAATLKKLVADGKLGRKTGEGFYDYSKK